MAYYYVKTDGANDGIKVTGSLTKQSGSFTTLGVSNYYATIALAITGGATSGDYICVSDSHSFTSDASQNYVGPVSGAGLTILTVDDANCDTQAAVPAAAQESVTSAGDFSFSGKVAAYSLHLNSSDQINLGSVCEVTLTDCILYWDVAISVNSDGANVRFINCELRYEDVNSYIRLAGGTTLSVIGGSIDSTAKMFSATGGNGGCHINLTGVDLSSITASGAVFSDFGNNWAGEDGLILNVSGCKLNATPPPWNNESFSRTNHRLTVTNSGPDSTAAEYQYLSESAHASAEDESGTYRDGSTAFPSGAKTSLKCTSLSTASPSIPFSFDFPTRFAELATPATDTLRIYLVSSATLYDSDVWAEVSYPDGTTKQLYNFLSTRHTDLLAANGTELTTNTEAWTNPPATPNYYQIDIDTSTGPGSDCYPIVRVYVAKASATIYFDSEIGVV